MAERGTCCEPIPPLGVIGAKWPTAICVQVGRCQRALSEVVVEAFTVGSVRCSS